MMSRKRKRSEESRRFALVKSTIKAIPFLALQVVATSVRSKRQIRTLSVARASQVATLQTKDLPSTAQIQMLRFLNPHATLQV